MMKWFVNRTVRSLWHSMHYDLVLRTRWTLHLEMMHQRHVPPTILSLIQRMGMKPNLPMSPRKQTILDMVELLTMKRLLAVGQMWILSLAFWYGVVHLL